ncbi:serum amyloid P-component-like [Brachionichthys hirsutus]|uniref:serum amyloid P-component-like n=1 Tax=Brachionichthys hirsutus TaxID=412623 RepID=UPI0036043E03
MKVLAVLVLVTACSAVTQDLSGKMFTFPQQTSTTNVRLTAKIQEFSTLTVCHRSFTDVRRDHSLFSMSASSIPNAVLIFWDEANKEMESHIRDIRGEYHGLDYKPNMWHSICTTWDSSTGLMQMWFNGQSLIRKYTSSGSVIRGSSIIVLGQEQDSHGGGFDMKQCFVGMMSDVHMWNYVLSPCEIHNYMDDRSFVPGNALNWKALDFQITGRVLIEDKITICG